MISNTECLKFFLRSKCFFLFLVPAPLDNTCIIFQLLDVIAVLPLEKILLRIEGIVFRVLILEKEKHLRESLLN